MVLHSNNINDISSTIGGATIYVEIIQGKNLVAKDRDLFTRQKNSSDPYVIVRYANRIYGRTRTVYKNCKSPVWNQTVCIELGADMAQQLFQLISMKHRWITAQQQQQSRIECCIMDEDVVTSDDPMGVVSVPIVSQSSQEHMYLYSQDTYTVTCGVEGTSYYCHNPKGTLEIGVLVTFQKMFSLQKGYAFKNDQLPVDQITIDLSWDVVTDWGHNIDLDTCCVAIDRDGNIALNETVYYGKLSNSNRSIVHSGDDVGQNHMAQSGDRESIHMDLRNISQKVQALYILLFVASPSYATFEAVRSAQVRILSTRTGKGLCCFVPNYVHYDYTALCLIRIARDNSNYSHCANRWTIAPILEGDQDARDFGSLIPIIKGYTRDILPNITIDPYERIALMEKSSVIRISDYMSSQSRPESVVFGLSWDNCSGMMNQNYLDVSAILLDYDFQLINTVHFNHQSALAGSVQHRSSLLADSNSIDGKNVISITLPNVPANVAYIGLGFNSYMGHQLDKFSIASCCLCNQKNNLAIARYTIKNMKDLKGYTSMLMGCLFRSSVLGGDENSWCFRIIAEPQHGRCVTENVSDLQCFLLTNQTREPSVPPALCNLYTKIYTPISIEKREIVFPNEEKHSTNNAMTGRIQDFLTPKSINGFLKTVNGVITLVVGIATIVDGVLTIVEIMGA